jgi:hypothetical protein
MPSSADVKLYGVFSKEIDLVWPEVLSFVEQALEYSDGEYSAEDIYNALKQTDMQLWIAYEIGKVRAICITQVISYPQIKRLWVLYSAGVEMPKWVHLIQLILEFGKAQGCTAARIFGRPGWEKALKEFGFKKIYTVLQADISEGTSC